MLAELRISIFREYPYLYDGDMEYEKHYLQKFSTGKDACIILAFFKQKVVGALSGLALSAEDESVYKVWLTFPEFNHVYYLSEILIEKSFRKLGLGNQMFDLMHEWVSSHFYTFSVLATVIRPDNHSLRPTDYRTLDHFWQNKGYRQIPDKKCFLSLKEIDQEVDTQNELSFWMKNFV